MSWSRRHQQVSLIRCNWRASACRHTCIHGGHAVVLSVANCSCDSCACASAGLCFSRSSDLIALEGQATKRVVCSLSSCLLPLLLQTELGSCLAGWLPGTAVPAHKTPASHWIGSWGQQGKARTAQRQAAASLTGRTAATAWQACLSCSQCTAWPSLICALSRRSAKARLARCRWRARRCMALSLSSG
jgi:hypothetical protein